jgi:hypothetical protein
MDRARRPWGNESCILRPKKTLIAGVKVSAMLQASQRLMDTQVAAVRDRALRWYRRPL